MKEREQKKQRKIDDYFRIIKKEKNPLHDVPSYDGDDESDASKSNPDNGNQETNDNWVEKSSNEVGMKFTEGSNEVSESIENHIEGSGEGEIVVQEIVPLPEVTSTGNHAAEADSHTRTDICDNETLLLKFDDAKKSVHSSKKGEKMTEVTESLILEEAVDASHDEDYAICDSTNEKNKNPMKGYDDVHCTNSTQTEELIQQEGYSQTEIIIQENSQTQTQTPTIDEKAQQTTCNAVNSREVQTDDIKQDDKESQTTVNVLTSREVQTEHESSQDEVIQTDNVVTLNSESQTENLPKVDAESQTELSNQNITTVDKIEVVDSMETSGTQTDQNELDDMSPFKADRTNIPADELDLSNGGDKDSNSEVESTFSSVSKNNDTAPVKVSAGLDMRVGKYKEVTFPPVSGLPNKPTTLKAPPSERTPLPMDLCTKEIGKEEEHKESSVTRKREIGSTISGSPYDYYKPPKSRRIDDMRIMPAHQGDVNISPRSTVHLLPTCLMSASTAILKKSSMSTIHEMPVRDLSVKSADIEYGHSPAVPSTIRSSSISPLKYFGKLSLQPEFRPPSMFKFGMEHKLPKKKIIPFSLPSEMQKSPILRSRQSDDEPTFQKLQKRNAKSRSVNKVQLYRDMFVKKESTDDEMKTRRTAQSKCEAEKDEDINLCSETMKEKEMGKSPKVRGLKMGCTVSRGRGLKRLLGTTHAKKLVSKAQSTSKKESSGTKPNFVKTGKKEQDKIPKMNIEKVDDQVLREMGDRAKVAKDEHKPKKVSNVVVTTKQLETNDKETRNEVAMNIKSSDNDDASLTFKDLKNSQKTSDESEESSQPTDSNSSDDRGDAGDSKSTSDYEDAGDIDEDIEEEEYEDGEAVDDDEYEEDSKSFNSTNEDINIEILAAYKNKVLTSPKSIASRIKDYSKKIGQEGIKFT